ncbi:MAG: hypothetical protein WDM87_17925 [Terracidiphilus sp.]
MNLGQAVAVCLYEIASRIGDKSTETSAPDPNQDPASNAAPASNRDLELLAGLVEETMLAANYSPPAMRNANRHDIHLLLRRLSLTRSDAGRILGFFGEFSGGSNATQTRNKSNRKHGEPLDGPRK